MSRDEHYSPFRGPMQAGTTHRPGELLFECLRGHDRIRCELRDHGPIYGVEVQFFINEEFSRGRRFDPRLDPSRTPRELAIAWAADERQALARDGSTT